MLKHIIFPTQKENEKILLLLRRHWLVALFIVLRYAFFLAAPVVVYAIYATWLPNSLTNITTGEISKTITIMSVSLYYLFVWVFFFHAWIDYYLDVWIITDIRIVNIEQKGLFSRSISELKLFRVQDVTAEVHGLLPTLFHYGEVTIQTAGNIQFFTFKQVPHPYETQQKISDLVVHDRKIHHLDKNSTIDPITDESV